jgi:hypothetical protein
VGIYTRAVLVVTAALIIVLGWMPSSLAQLSSQSAFTPYAMSPALGVPIPRATPDPAP